MKHRLAIGGAGLAVRIVLYPLLAGAWAYVFITALQWLLVRVGVEGTGLHVVAPLIGIVAGLRVAYTNLFYRLVRAPRTAADSAPQHDEKSNSASEP